MHFPRRARLRALICAACCAVLGAGLPTGASTATAAPRVKAVGSKVVSYFTEWGTYDRKYHVRNIETSGSAAKLTHIDAYAATDRTHTAVESVDGVADTWNQPLRGNFNQLRELKKEHPGLKVIWSFGG